MLDGNEITYGVELECSTPQRWMSNHDVYPGDYHSGHLAGNPFPSGWKVESDSSIHRPDDGDESYYATEYISPVLHGLEGLESIRKVVEILREAGAKVNDSTGCHVHVGLKSILGTGFPNIIAYTTRLTRLVIAHETALIALSGKQARIGNHYAQPLKGRLKDWDSHISRSKFEGDIQSIERYRILNLMPIFDNRHTVEFRCFSGTITPRKAMGYVVVSVGLAALAYSQTRAMPYDDTPDNWQNANEAVLRLHKAIRGHGIPVSEEVWADIVQSQRNGAKAIESIYKVED